MGRNNREVRVRVNTQEEERNTRLGLVFPLTLLSCSARLQCALQQNKAQSKLLYWLIFTHSVRQFYERFFLLSTPSIRELKTSSDGWVNDNHNKHNNSFNLSSFFLLF